MGAESISLETEKSRTNQETRDLGFKHLSAGTMRRPDGVLIMGNKDKGTPDTVTRHRGFADFVQINGETGKKMCHLS